MTTEDQQKRIEAKQYAIRLDIESSMYGLWEAGFSIDEVEEFVRQVVSEMREEES